jgi:hypothetical protein
MNLYNIAPGHWAGSPDADPRADHMANQVYETTGSFGDEDADELPTTWSTRDGGAIAITDMSDAHLCNAARMLRRNAPKDGPNLIDDRYVRSTYPIYDALRCEMDRRGLEMPS